MGRTCLGEFAAALFFEPTNMYPGNMRLAMCGNSRLSSLQRGPHEANEVRRHYSESQESLPPGKMCHIL